MVLMTKNIATLLARPLLSCKTPSQRLLVCESVSRRTVVSISTERPPMLLEKAAQLVDTEVSHFDIRNLMKKEHDLSTFALDKVSKMQDDLVSVKHPIINVAHEIFNHEEERSRSSLGGFCLLLLAKSLQSVPSYIPSDETWKKQKIFAECYEMIDKAMYLHHHAIIDIPLDYQDIATMNAQNNGNKLAVLGGDYLFSYAIIRLASLVRRANVFDFIGASIDEFCINHFDEKSAQNEREKRTLSSSPASSSSLSPPLFSSSALFESRVRHNQHPWSRVDCTYWERFGGYCSTDLLAYSSQYISMMSGLFSIRYEKAAFKFGYNLRLLWNLKDDIASVQNGSRKINLISLPIIQYLEKNPKYKDTLSKVDINDADSMENIRKTVSNSETIDGCQKLLFKYSDKCLKSLSVFPNCSTRDTLESICQV